MAELLDIVAFLERHCKTTGDWVVLLTLPRYDAAMVPELYSAAPILSENSQVVLDGYGIVHCGSEAEAMLEFQRVVGDDGPTAENPYSGPVKVAATVIGPVGVCNENT